MGIESGMQGNTVVNQHEQKRDEPGVQSMTAKAQNFFTDFKKDINEWEVGADGFSDDNAKEAARNVLDSCAARIRDLDRETEAIAPADRKYYAEPLAIIMQRYATAENNREMGYEQYPEDMRETIRSKDIQADKLFLSVGAKLFPDVYPPRGATEAVVMIQQMSAQSWVGDERRITLKHLASESGDITKLLRYIDVELQFASGQIGYRASVPLLDGQGEVSASDKDWLLEGEAYVLQLRLIRDRLQDDLDRKAGVSKDDRDQVTVEKSEGSEFAQTKQETPEPKYSHQELYALLASIRTVEQARMQITPEIKQQFLDELLADVDKKIEVAQEFKKTGKIGSNAVLEARAFGNFTGAGAVADHTVRFTLAALGGYVSGETIQSMSMVDVLKKYFDYDLSQDQQRSQLLRQHTNIFG